MTIVRIITIVSLLVGLNFGAAAATNDGSVLVVFNGTSEVNRETFKFLTRNLRDQISFPLVAAPSPATVNASNYKAVIVLNTGRTTGLDPVLKAFMDKYPNKAALIVVNLIQGSTLTSVQSTQRSASAVDTITAASAWSEGADKGTWIGVHQGWIRQVAALIRGQ